MKMSEIGGSQRWTACFWATALSLLLLIPLAASAQSASTIDADPQLASIDSLPGNSDSLLTATAAQGTSALTAKLSTDKKLVYTGRFSITDRTQLLAYDPGNDDWSLGTHDGNRMTWTTVGNTIGFGHGHLTGQLVYTGSFSTGAAGRTEVLFYNPGDDNWWLGTMDGNALRWARVGITTGFGHGHLTRQLVYVGSFSGAAGGRSQILFYNPGDDNWWLGTHQGGVIHWDLVDNTRGFGHGHLTKQLVYIGSFSAAAAGRSEVLFYNPGDDNWWLATHEGARLRWSLIDNTVGFGHGHLAKQLVYIGSFSPVAAGRSEVLFYNPGDDNWWLARHEGGRLYWTLVSNTFGFGHRHLVTQLVYVGSFSTAAARRSEILFYNPGDDNWWLATHDGSQFKWSLVDNTTDFGRRHLTTQDVYIGSFSSGAQGRSEVLFFNLGDGHWWLGTLQGSSLSWALIFAPPPTAPTSLNVTDVSENSVSLGWSNTNKAGDVIVSIKVERRTSATAFQETASLASDAKSFVDRNLALGITYYYRTRAVTPFDASQYSNEARATTAWKPPSVTFSANPSTINRGEKATLRFNVTGNVTSIRIDQGIGSVEANGTRTVSPTNTTTYTLVATGPGGQTTASARVDVLVPPTSGDQYVSLWQSAPGSFIYNGTVSDPASGRHAQIKTVKNNSSYTYTLSHGGGFVLLRPGDVITGSGNVEGNWTAQFSGSYTDLPSSLSFVVSWVAPN